MSFSASVAELVQNSASPLVGAAPSWVRVELADVAAILNGYPWKSAYFNDQLGEPVIRIRDVTSGSTETKYRGEVVDGYWIENGDLLVGMDGDFNVRVWDGGRALLNQRVCRIAPDKSVYLPELLAHVLPGYLQLIHDETHSITVKHLSSKTLAEIPLPLPPLAEQRRIVAKIDSLTGKSRRARDHLDHIPRLVEKYKQAVLGAAFSLERGTRTRLGELVLPSAPIRYGVLQPGAVKDVGVPLIRVCDLKNGKVAWSELRRISPPIDQQFSSARVRNGDVLITVVGTIGRVAIVSGMTEQANIARAVARIRPDPNKALPEWLRLRLTNDDCQRSFALDAREVARKTLNVSLVKAISIEVPSLDAQAKTVRRIETAFNWIDRLASEATSARRLIDRLDQAVLAKAFRGELVPQDPEDEPASMLLERIRAERGAAPKTRRGRKGMRSNL